MEKHPERLYFEEEQRFPLWIKAIVLVPIVALGCPAILMGFLGGANLGPVRGLFTVLTLVFTMLTLLALAGAVLTFRMKLVTKLDARHLHLRIHPQRWSLLPSRMTHKDIALGEISQWEIRTYNALLNTEYWGWHFWGLAVAKGGRYLYMMRPSSLIRGRGVHLQLGSGERVLVGTEHAEELVNAIALARSGSP
jgi:hypothetical protein